MRVCILAPENSPSAGGVGAYTYNLARSLSKSHDVHLVSIRRDTDDTDDTLESLLSHSCTVTYAAEASADSAFLYNAKFQMKLATYLGRYVRKNGIELVHSHSGHVPHLISQLLDRTPLVSTVHATIRGLRRAIRSVKRRIPAENLTDVLAPLIEIAETAGFSMADRLLPVSRFTLLQLIELYDPSYQAKAEILPNAVDPELFAPSSESEDGPPVLLNVARPHGIKGLETFLEIAAALRRTYPNLTAKVVGYRPPQASAQTRLDHAGTGFIGRVRYLEMPTFYNQSTVTVVTSVYENCPGVVLEAMSCGRVVVAPWIPGITEIIQDGKTGCLYDPTTPGALRDKVSELVANPDLRRRIGTTARSRTLDAYSWSKRLSAIETVYRQVQNEDYAH